MIEALTRLRTSIHSLRGQPEAYVEVSTASGESIDPCTSAEDRHERKDRYSKLRMLLWDRFICLEVSMANPSPSTSGLVDSATSFCRREKHGLKDTSAHAAQFRFTGPYLVFIIVVVFSPTFKRHSIDPVPITLFSSAEKASVAFKRRAKTLADLADLAGGLQPVVYTQLLACPSPRGLHFNDLFPPCSNC